MTQNKPVLIVLVGLPGSGKSTFRAKLKEHLTFMPISSDDYVDEVARRHNTTYGKVFEHAISEATRQMNLDVQEAVNKKFNVVWDQTNLTVKKRKKILDKFPDYVKIAVDFDVHPLELYKRLYRRCGETGKFIPVGIIEDMLKTASIPSYEEGFDEIIWYLDLNKLVEYLQVSN